MKAIANLPSDQIIAQLYADTRPAVKTLKGQSSMKAESGRKALFFFFTSISKT